MASTLFYSILLSSLLAPLSGASIITDVSQLDSAVASSTVTMSNFRTSSSSPQIDASTAECVSKAYYDYIIVGGGTAGNVVANRLTEDPKIRVLVIEAGITNDGEIPAIVPFLCAQASPNTALTWNYTTTPQSGFTDNRAVTYPRGKLLGGSSSINFMFYTRGSSDDFNRYAQVTGDSGWSWDNIQPYIKKHENWVSPADGHDTTGEFDPSVHSTGGPLDVSLPGWATPLDDRVMQTTQELSSEFPFNLDMNSGSTLGVGWAQSTIGGGARSSSATAYLSATYQARPNLDVILNTQVTKLLQTGVTSPKAGLPVFLALEFAQSSGGPRFRIAAKREIIVSAGSVNTPQLLMLSGIGDRTALSAQGITTIANLPDVGQNLSDHPMLPNQFFVNSTDTFEAIEQNGTFANQLSELWATTLTGPLTNTLANHLGWFRLPSSDPIFETYADPSAGPNTAHIEFIIANGFASWVEAWPTTGNYMSILTTVASPASRGSITLKSNDPFDYPNIDPAFLKSPFDLHVMVEAVKSVRRFLAASPWKGYVLEPYGSGASLDITSDAAIEKFAQDFTASEWHPVGTASMSPEGASQGVVDPDLTVKGVSGLRVVDASVLPFVPASHIQAAIYIIAERAADLIKADQY